MSTDNYQSLVNLVNTIYELETYQQALILIGLISLLICYFYIICCFGHARPPLPYETIVGKFANRSTSS